jgi:hypothetical protein
MGASCLIKVYAQQGVPVKKAVNRAQGTEEAAEKPEHPYRKGQDTDKEG